MPYIGNVPAEAYSQVSYQDLTGGSGTSFTLDYPAGSAGEIEVFVNNVRQEPTVAYTVNGTALTMTGSVAATDDFYIVFQGKAEKSGTIPEKQTDGTYVFPNAVDVTGTVTSDGLTADASGTPASFNRTDGNAALLELKTSGSVRGYIGADATGSTVFYSGAAAERLRILSSGGITFNGDTATANALNDYEFGSWNPRLRGDVAEPGTLLIGYGRYVKVGDFVYLDFAFENMNTTGYSGQVQVDQFPFTVGSTTRRVAVGSSFNAITWTDQLILEVPAGNTKCVFNNARSGNAWNAANHSAGATRYIWGSVSYTVT